MKPLSDLRIRNSRHRRLANITTMKGAMSLRKRQAQLDTLFNVIIAQLG